jgi:hypothetical protein
VLLELGRRLELPMPTHLNNNDEFAVRDTLVQWLLKIRDKNGNLCNIELNRAQREYAKRATRYNIVLKARQLGISTYVAARYFIDTITHPGTLTVQVAHDQESAEQIFRIVHRFLANMPQALQNGLLRTSRANIRQLVFPELEAISNREIVDEQKFEQGLGKIIDGVVDCLNASAWAKQK